MIAIKKDGAFDSHFNWWVNRNIGRAPIGAAWQYGLNFVASTHKVIVIYAIPWKAANFNIHERRTSARWLITDNHVIITVIFVRFNRHDICGSDLNIQPFFNNTDYGWRCGSPIVFVSHRFIFGERLDEFLHILELFKCG